MKKTQKLEQIVTELSAELTHGNEFAKQVEQAAKNYSLAKSKLSELQGLLKDIHKEDVQERILTLLEEMKALEVVKKENHAPYEGVYNLYGESDLDQIKSYINDLKEF